MIIDRNSKKFLNFYSEPIPGFFGWLKSINMGKLAIYKPSRHKHQWFGVCLCPPGKFRSNHSINPVLVSNWEILCLFQCTHAKYSNMSTSYYVHWVCRPALAQTDIIKANRVNHTTYAELKDEKRWGLFVFFGSELLKTFHFQWPPGHTHQELFLKLTTYCL